MYTPAAFDVTDLDALDLLFTRDPFVTLVTVVDSTPCVSHLPVLYARDGDAVTLRGHWARPNPQTRHAGPALAIVHGPHAYVSPGWYPDKHEAARVPTWNYATAHLHGALECFDDTASLADLVDAQSRHHEAQVGGNWTLERDSDALMRQLRGIVGFRMRVDRMQVKFKLSQNHPRANRASVAAALDGLATPASIEMAALMRAFDPDTD